MSLILGIKFGFKQTKTSINPSHIIDVQNNFFQCTQPKKIGKMTKNGKSAVLDPVRYKTKKLNTATKKYKIRNEILLTCTNRYIHNRQKKSIIMAYMFAFIKVALILLDGELKI